MVSIIDPEGFPVNVVFGQDPVEVLDAPREKVVLNYPEEKPRKRMFNRFEPGPVPVYKVWIRPQASAFNVNS